MNSIVPPDPRRTDPGWPDRRRALAEVVAVAVAVVVAASAGCRGKAAPARDAPIAEAGPSTAPSRYLKGQLHVHTDRSGDSRTPPEDVARWYGARGFDFLVFTDHNAVTTAVDGPVLTIPGAELTQNSARCLPPPPEGVACLLHVNALFVDTLGTRRIALGPSDGLGRLAIYQFALDQVEALGGIAQLNHPNMSWAVDADLVVELVRRGVVLMEIANQNEVESNAGDAAHPSTEALWDQYLAAEEMTGSDRRGAPMARREEWSWVAPQ